MFGEKEKQVIYLGSDHAGFNEKAELKKFLEGQEYSVTDLGGFTEEPQDYPLVAREVGEKVRERNGSFGILLCGTGIGMSIAANKMKGIRAALCKDEEMAEMSRRHNNANILTMGARSMDLELMKKVALKFVKTDFEKDEERHVNRVNKIADLEKL